MHAAGMPGHRAYLSLPQVSCSEQESWDRLHCSVHRKERAEGRACSPDGLAMAELAVDELHDDADGAAEAAAHGGGDGAACHHLSSSTSSAGDLPHDAADVE